jgi:hypothetical protein
MKRILLSLVVLAGCDLRQLALTGDGGGSTRDAAGGAGGVGGAGGSGGIDAPRPDAMEHDAGTDGCVPMAEICNGIDDDCDGVIDNGFDLNTDVNNCGACNNRCLFANAVPQCLGGICHILTCDVGYGNADGIESNGCECTQTNGGIEICDGIDNNCNGVIDEGFNLQTDPANCGTCGHRCNFMNAVGACTGGTCVLDHCLPNFYNIDGDPSNGCEYGCLVSNGGTEICDGLDNDCNGQIDDMPIDAGQACFPFGTGCTPNGSGGYNCTGVCRAGTTTCANGFLQCLGFTGPSIEICDNLDNDCNGVVDDPFNKQTDPLHCGSCSPCNIPHAIPSCTNGVCGILACAPDFHDIDGNLANGCEYQCHATGPEICDGLDNNCNGQIDEGFDKQNDPNNCGPSCTRCGFPHASALCTSGTCALGACDPGYVNLDGQAANGCEYQCTFTSATEICNGVDDNCNGQVDEGFNLQTDANNCGSCNHVCQFNHAAATCVNGGCVMGACNPGFVNLNGMTSDGCEYQCTVTNGGVEICDGLDNNCNGQVDESDARIGQACNPALSDPSRWNVGTCRAGTFACTNGNLVCNNYVGPVPEICDNRDNDCDGVIDNGFNLTTDPNHCGSCTHVCANDFTVGSPHAVPGCAGGTCTISACDVGFYNNDGAFANGCEYACNGTPGTPEVCDGVDNDCDGQTDGADSHLGCTSSAQCPQAALGETCVANRCSATITTSCTTSAQCPAGETCIAAGRCTGDIRQVANFCNQVGACAGAVPQCNSGAWVCNYGPNVQTTGPNQIIGNETLCDGIDNDCDGCIDESFPQVAHPAGSTCAAQSATNCSDTGIGACQRTGTFQCDLTSGSPTFHQAICVLTSPVVTPTNELCDGIDNDCDGLVDESWDDPSGTTRCSGSRCTGVRPATALVSSVNVAKFESARPDAARPINCPTNACPGGQSCNSATHECELPCTTSNAFSVCASGICVVASGQTSGFCEPGQGVISPIACTSNGQCPSGACVRLADGPTATGEPATGCTSTSGQPLCFCLPATGAQAPLACSVSGAEPWSNVTIQQAEFACEMAGMHLCGAADWSRACCGGASCGTTYPYGATYVAATCNGHDLDADSLVGGNQDIAAPTGNLTACVTAAAISDLSGNLAEWTNDFTGVRLADGTNRAVYRARGGAFDTTGFGNGLTCGFTSDVIPEDFSFPNTGFRCCSACAAGQADCGAAGCKTLSNDAANCGYCGHACTAGQLCCNGVCRTTAACPALP